MEAEFSVCMETATRSVDLAHANQILNNNILLMTLVCVKPTQIEEFFLMVLV